MSAGHVLIAKVGAVTCAIPIAYVVETMRPLPVEPPAHPAACVRGVAIIRGVPTPVVDTARLLGAAAGAPGRYVVVRARDRAVALEVDRVVDVRPLTGVELAALPPLVRAAAPDAIAAIGSADRDVVVLLEAARLIPEVA